MVSAGTCPVDRLVTCKLLLTTRSARPPSQTDTLAYHDLDRRRRPSRTPTRARAALDRVGDRWSLLLVEALLDGLAPVQRPRRVVPGIAPNILTDRLRRLEREGIVLATPVQPAAAPDGVRADRRRARAGGRAPPARRLGRPARRRGAGTSRCATRCAGRRSRPAGTARRARVDGPGPTRPKRGASRPVLVGSAGPSSNRKTGPGRLRSPLPGERHDDLTTLPTETPSMTSTARPTTITTTSSTSTTAASSTTSPRWTAGGCSSSSASAA